MTCDIFDALEMLDRIGYRLLDVRATYRRFVYDIMMPDNLRLLDVQVDIPVDPTSKPRIIEVIKLKIPAEPPRPNKPGEKKQYGWRMPPESWELLGLAKAVGIAVNANAKMIDPEAV